MDEKLKISNDECLLVHFFNNGNSFQVGYQNWLVEKLDDLDDIIENEKTVTIMWPEKTEICEASLLKKNLSKSTTWKKYPIKILSQGSK